MVLKRFMLESLSVFSFSSDTCNFSHKKVLSISRFLTLSSGFDREATFSFRSLILLRFSLDFYNAYSLPSNIFYICIFLCSQRLRHNVHGSFNTCLINHIRFFVLGSCWLRWWHWRSTLYFGCFGSISFHCSLFSSHHR